MFGIPTYRSVQRTDMSLIFDAILFDRSLYNPLFNYLSTVRCCFRLQRRRGNYSATLMSASARSQLPPGGTMLRKLTDEMDFITVRDQDSYKILMDIGVKNPRILVTADAALTMAPASDARTEEILQSAGFSSNEEILAINVSKYIDTWAGAGTQPMGKEKFVELYSAALNKALKKIQAPVLFICTQVHDIPLTQAIMDRTTAAPKKGMITNVLYNHYDIKGVLGKVSLLAACGCMQRFSLRQG